jgi:hypothetical protein
MCLSFISNLLGRSKASSSQRSPYNKVDNHANTSRVKQKVDFVSVLY